MVRFRGSAVAHVAMLSLLYGSLAQAQSQSQTKPKNTKPKNAVLWTDPGDINARNLFWGSGGKERQPKPPAEFVEEDMHGTNPKFDVEDSAGEKWRVKMGPEARPEVAASRLLWAVGYTTNDNYFLPMLHVNKMPAHLRRGQAFSGSGGDVPNVRLQRRPKGLKRVGNWNWNVNPFVGTREFNGLRVMMALLRNWDLYDDNTAILADEHDAERGVYMVTDLGATFGTTGRRYHHRNSVGKLDAYQQGRLVKRIRPDSVDLAFPSMPPLSFVVDVPFYRNQLHVHSIGKNIPRADAKWIGSLLAQLSPDQIRDAFRAAGYSPIIVEGFTAAILSRIKELKDL
jgi:hypothetical protein